jgi:hypothetical protein
MEAAFDSDTIRICINYSQLTSLAVNGSHGYKHHRMYASPSLLLQVCKNIQRLRMHMQTRIPTTITKYA